MEPTHQDAGEARKAAQSVEEDTTMTEHDTQPEAKSDQPGEQTTSPPDIVGTEAASRSGDVKAEDAVSSSVTASAAASAAAEPTGTAGAGPSSAMSSSAPVVRVFNPAEATSSASTPCTCRSYRTHPLSFLFIIIRTNPASSTLWTLYNSAVGHASAVQADPYSGP